MPKMIDTQINEIIISDDQLERLVSRVQIHTCRFDDLEAKQIHNFAELLNGQGIENIREVIAAGAWLKASKKTGNAVLIASLVASLIGATWIGIVKIIKGS
jgi:hypothetical protein